MIRDRGRDHDVGAALAVGVAFAVVVVGYQAVRGSALLPALLTTDPVGAGELLTLLAVASVPFALGAGAALLALRLGVYAPAALGAVAVWLLVALEPNGDLALVLVQACLAAAVVAGAIEVGVRGVAGRLSREPSPAGRVAVLAGVAVAATYTGLFAVRVLIPVLVSNPLVGYDPALAAAATAYFLGLHLLLVGAPVGSLVRYRLVLPFLGAAVAVGADLFLVWPDVAAGGQGLLTGATTYLLVLPIAALAVLGAGAVEYVLRSRLGFAPPRPMG